MTGKQDVELKVQLWDAAARAGQGLMLAAGSLTLDASGWHQGAAKQKSVTLQAEGDKQVGSFASPFHSFNVLTVALLMFCQAELDGQGQRFIAHWVKFCSPCNQAGS